MYGIPYQDNHSDNFAHSWTAAGIEIGAWGIGAGMEKAAEKSMAGALSREIMGPWQPGSKVSSMYSAADNKTISRASKMSSAGAKIGKLSRIMGYGTLFALGTEIGGGVINTIADYSRGRRVKSLAPLSEENNYNMGGMATNAAFTQRQRAIQVIHNSQMSTRAAFGNEASYMHM